MDYDNIEQEQYNLLVSVEPVKYVKLTGNKGSPSKKIWGQIPRTAEKIYAPHNAKAPRVGSPYSLYDSNYNLRRRVEFESELAAVILNNPDFVGDAFKSMARSLNDFLVKLNYCTDSKTSVNKMISPDLLLYLYPDKPYFGKKTQAAPTRDDEVVRQALKVLKPGRQRYDIGQTLNVHSAMAKFIREANKNTVGPSPKKELVDFFKYYQHYIFKFTKKFRPRALFKNRGRSPKAASLPVTDTVGIIASSKRSDSPFNFSVQPHVRAVDGCERDIMNVSNFVDESWKHDLPFVAGPSGSTVEGVSLAMTLKSFDRYNKQPLPENRQKELLRQYTLAWVAFMVGSGSHSHHEVMVVASLVKDNIIEYKRGDYDSAFPKSFTDSQAYKDLQSKYPEFLKIQEKLGGSPTFRTLFTGKPPKRSHAEAFLKPVPIINSNKKLKL